MSIYITTQYNIKKHYQIMKEQLVSFETAKLAKEKGFGLGEDDYTILPTVYESNGSLYNNGELSGIVVRKHTNRPTHLGADTKDDFEVSIFCLDNSLDEYILAPTQSLLQKWLREKHNIQICNNLHYKGGGGIAGYLIDISHPNGDFKSTSIAENTYEEALEKGLQEALKLIKQ